MPSLLTRLFGVGKLPEQVSAAAAEPATLLSAEGVSVKVSAAHVKIKTRRISHSVGLKVGAVVLTPNRLILVLGRKVAFDLPYDETAPANSALTFTGDHSGLHLTLDIPAAIPDGTGTVEFEVRTTLPANALAWLQSQPHVIALTEEQTIWITRWT